MNLVPDSSVKLAGFDLIAERKYPGRLEYGNGEDPHARNGIMYPTVKPKIFVSIITGCGLSSRYSAINSFTASHRAQRESINAEKSRVIYKIFITIESFFLCQS